MSDSRLFRPGILVALLATASACDSRVISIPDASPSSDAGSDASELDAGSSPASLFEACTSDDECEVGLICETSFPGRFCTHACTTWEDCGEEGDCSFGHCVPTCTSGERDCDRLGGMCLGYATSCEAACGAVGISTTTCGEGLTCDPYLGRCTTTPSTDGGDVGAPCDSPDDCRTGLCFLEYSRTSRQPTGWLGGACLARTRSRGPDVLPERNGCPVGSVTAMGELEGDAVYCVPECLEHTDCRPGYGCALPPGASIGLCLPIDCDAPGARECPEGSSCQLALDARRRCVRCTPVCGGRECGPDSCGGTCGACDTMELCTAEGTCECIPEDPAELCAAAGAACGSLTTTNRCGVTVTVTCGSCVAPSTCGSIEPNQCGCVGQTDAMLCSAAGANCGTISSTDRCGATRTVACGSCVAPATCGALMPNRCGCVGESVAELCTARGASCGTISVTDRCGVGRSVTCGTCTLPETCGGAGVPNTCGVCAPNCAGRVCGTDGCGGSCGSCPAGQRCNTSGGCEPIPCDPVSNTLCGPGQKCDWTGSSTACVTAGTGLAGAACFNTTQCATQHTCTAEDFCREYCTSSFHCTSGICALDAVGTPYGLCSRPCDPVWGTASDGCDFGRCRLLDTARATEFTDCGPLGSAATGSSCAATEDCSRGLACISSRCRRVCSLGSACSSGTCSVVPGWTTYGVCLP